MKNNIKIVLLTFILPFTIMLSVQCQYEAAGMHTNIANRSVTETGNTGEFAENSIIAVLQETDLYKEFSLEDFPEAQEWCVDVVELTSGMTALLRKQAEAEITGNWEELQYHIDHSMLMNKDTYKRILKFSTKSNNIFDVISLLENREDILHAEPDYLGKLDAVPNPLPVKWSYQQNIFERISLPMAWEIETGKSSIMVGVVDSGIQASHPALLGRVSVPLSRDFSTGDPNGQPGIGPWGLQDVLLSTIGHGTFIGGILAGNGNDIIGVCWDVTLVSLQVANMFGSVSESDVINAISYAAYAGIPILNISLGFYSYNYGMAIGIQNYAGLVVASAGNDNGRDLSLDPKYPA